MATSPTQRTLKFLKDEGYQSGMVERFLSFAGKFGKRVDLFHFIDIIAMGHGRILGVQSCGQSFSAHHKKLTEDKEVRANVICWLENGGALWLVGWRKIKKVKGGKAMVWKPRLRAYELEWNSYAAGAAQNLTYKDF